MSIRMAEVRPYCFFFLCFGRGTSLARRDHGGSLALSESCRGYCRSRYDAEITRNRQWRQHITADLPDASKMYDWKYIYIHLYIYIYIYIYIYAHIHKTSLVGFRKYIYLNHGEGENRCMWELWQQKNILHMYSFRFGASAERVLSFTRDSYSEWRFGSFRPFLEGIVDKAIEEEEINICIFFHPVTKVNSLTSICFRRVVIDA